MVSIVAIGTEITRGELVNTNATWLADRLVAAGFHVSQVLACEDDEAAIVRMLDFCAGASQLIVVTGGLGPTSDDVTAAAAALWLGEPLQRHPQAIGVTERRLSALQRTLNEVQLKQADLPRSAEVLDNPHGTAAGFAVCHPLNGARALFMPGVPREMKPMFTEQLLPRIAHLAVHGEMQVRLLTYGMGEGQLAQHLQSFEAAHRPYLTLGYRVYFPEVELKLLLNVSQCPRPAAEQMHALRAELQAQLGPVLLGEMPTSLPRQVAQHLRRLGRRLAVAESCTGGLIAHLLTEEPASDLFDMGLVTYANWAKTRLLGVSEALLESHGAVSEEVARAMAQQMRALSGADYALAVTGIAGPSGGSAEKPVGLVYIAIAAAHATHVHRFNWGGERVTIQRHAAYRALDLVRQMLME